MVLPSLKKLSTRFTLLLAIVFILGTFLSWVILSRALTERVQMEVTNKAAILVGMMNSVRSYTTTHVAPLLADMQASSGKFIPETVPAFSAREVFDTLRKSPDYSNFLYKEATLNPTNQRDKADDFEASLVNQFKQDSTLTELTGARMLNGTESFYIARPFIIKNEACLACHSTPDKAPASLISTYGSENGFGWHLNEVIGSQVIYVPSSAVQDTARQAILLVMSVFIVIFALILVLINRLLTHNVVRPIEFMAHIARKVTAGAMQFDDAELAKMAKVAARPDEIGQSAQALQQMTKEVKAREERLSLQVRRLKVEVDEARKQRQVEEVTESEYFQQLKDKVKALKGAPPPTKPTTT